MYIICAQTQTHMTNTKNAQCSWVHRDGFTDQKGQTCKSRVETLTPDKWTVADAVHNYGTDFESATPWQLKQATFHFLELHMQRALA